MKSFIKADMFKPLIQSMAFATTFAIYHKYITYKNNKIYNENLLSQMKLMKKIKETN